MSIKHIYKLIGSLEKIPHDDDGDGGDGKKTKSDIEEILCFYQNFIHFTFNNISGKSMWINSNFIQRQSKWENKLNRWFLCFNFCCSSGLYGDNGAFYMRNWKLEKSFHQRQSTFWNRWTQYGSQSALINIKDESGHDYTQVLRPHTSEDRLLIAHHFPFYDGQLTVIFSEIPFCRFLMDSIPVGNHIGPLLIGIGNYLW